MQSRLQHGDENEEKGASLPRSIPSMAAVYTTIGIGKHYTGQPGRPRVSACRPGVRVGPTEPEWSFGLKSKKKRTRGGKVPIQYQLLPLASLATFPLPANSDVPFPKIIDDKIRNNALMYDAFCHVRLYAFAEQYQIQDLMNLVLRKLHKVLWISPSVLCVWVNWFSYWS